MTVLPGHQLLKPVPYANSNPSSLAAVTLLSRGAGPKLKVVTSWFVLLLCEYTVVLR